MINKPHRDCPPPPFLVQTTATPHPVLLLPPSTTGKRGAISKNTLLSLAAAHARARVAVVILSGARSTTLATRLPFLPPATAVAAENGGRLWWADPGRPTLAPLAEDAAWRDAHAAAAGPRANDGLPPLHRTGPLWDAYRDLISEGWTPDASGYTTSFRLPLRAGQTDADLDAALARLPPSLAHSRNLGCADVYPASSGKAAVGAYVAQKLNCALSASAFLCDDDNDLALAARVGRAFVVSVTHGAVAAAVAADPGRYWTTPLAGTRAADAAVGAALAWLGEETGVGGEDGAAGGAHVREAVLVLKEGR
jgi:hypothetical protein